MITANVYIGFLFDRHGQCIWLILGCWLSCFQYGPICIEINIVQFMSFSIRLLNVTIENWNPLANGSYLGPSAARSL